MSMGFIFWLFLLEVMASFLPEIHYTVTHATLA